MDGAGNWGWIMLAAFAGVAAFILSAVVGKALHYSRPQSRFRAQNERLMQLFHHRVELENEALVVDQEIAQIVESESVDKAYWIQRVQQISASLAPMVREQIERFGLAKPPTSPYRVAPTQEEHRERTAPPSPAALIPPHPNYGNDPPHQYEGSIVQAIDAIVAEKANGHAKTHPWTGKPIN